MNIRWLKSLIVALFGLTAAGCISHSFFIDLSGDGPISYVVEGDSLDLNDGRISFPPGPPWVEVDSNKENGDEENDSWKISYEAPFADTIPIPIAPPEKNARFILQRKNLLIARKTSFEAVFPGWDVIENYGDVEEFVPPEAELLKDSSLDSLMNEGRRMQLRRLEALGLQKGTARRYMMQMQQILEIWQRQNGDGKVDSAIIKEGMERFSAVLKAHLFSFRDLDPLDVSLEWYPELRGTMISVGEELTGGSFERLARIADSLEYRWKTWVDIGDDTIELTVVLPGAWIKAEPDSARGDTLFWNITPEELAGGQKVIRAAGWTFLPGGYILTALLIAVGITILMKLAKQRDRTAKNELLTKEQ